MFWAPQLWSSVAPVGVTHPLRPFFSVGISGTVRANKLAIYCCRDAPPLPPHMACLLYVSSPETQQLWQPIRNINSPLLAVLFKPTVRKPDAQPINTRLSLNIPLGYSMLANYCLFCGDKSHLSRWHNSNNAWDPPTKLLAFCVWYLSFRSSR